MINFIEHPKFTKLYLSFCKTYSSKNDLEYLKKILTVQFDPINPKQAIGPGKIHRVKVFETYELWKVEMSVKGLKKNQSPRIWFVVSGDTLAFLVLKSHIDNYDNNKVDKEAELLITDIF